MIFREKVLWLVAILALVVLSFSACRPSGDAPTSKVAAAKYHCPMHPNYVSDHPGDCPICNMKLVPVPQATAKAEPSVTTMTQAERYHCPMHPNYVSDKPGECPICHMDLVLIKTEGSGGQATSTNTPGRVTIVLNSEKQQLIGVRFTPVTKRVLTQVVRLTALVEHDESKLARIAPRFGGWVRTLYVNTTGQNVERGDPLLTVYSPELVSAENEYLLAFQRFERLKEKRDDPQYEPARRLLESAHRRLELWEIGGSEIRELEKSGMPKDELEFRSPVSGHVISKMAIAGRAFSAGETLFEIGDMDPLWLRASVYEYELPLIHTGQKAHAIFPALGNRSIDTEVDFIYPHIDVQTRRAEIRLKLDNPRHELRPQMWCTVEVQAAIGEVLAVPASALIDTGKRYLAFVQGKDHHLEPRAVSVGAKTDDFFEVRSGLQENEQVVTRALFLVDSESQLQAAISGMTLSAEAKD
jgi:membrane fusion protein, copper/silver efflux system